MEQLKKIGVRFKQGKEYGSKEHEQALLEEMQPHRDIKKLELEGYHGEIMPRWRGRGDNSTLFYLPNLVTLKTFKCSRLLSLPWEVSQLPCLKQLQLVELQNLEYVMDMDPETPGSGEGLPAFSSLVELRFHVLPKLKGWWGRSESGLHAVNPDKIGGNNQEPQLVWVSSPCFPLLKWLVIEYCQNMTHIPVCPRLEYLEMYDSRRTLFWSNFLSRPRRLSSYVKGSLLRVNSLEFPKSMPAEYIQSIGGIEIESEERVESLGEIKEMLPTLLLPSLCFLGIKSCPKLRSVRGWLEHLSALECLNISDCPNLLPRGIPWQHLSSLQSLCMESFKEMKELPEGLQYCTSLRSLKVWDWPKLECLPKWMPNLTSLRELQLRRCSKGLEERCQQPFGEDLVLIRHITSLIF